MVDVQTNDNAALFLGANPKVKAVLEVPAGAERTLSKGTFVTQKTGDGSTFVLHTEQLTTPIDGVIYADLLVPASGSAANFNTWRVYGGHVDEAILVTVNSLTTLDDIPAGASQSVRVQLENKGFQPDLRKSL